jgi:hypothetical protein
MQQVTASTSAHVACGVGSVSACKDIPLRDDLAMCVGGMSLGNRGTSTSGTGDRLSGATSQTSESMLQKGLKAEKAQSSDHGSDGQVCFAV